MIKKLYPLFILLAAVFVFESCRRGGNRHVKEGIDNALLAFIYMLAIVSFGITAMALSIAYNKRKKDKDSLLIASIIILIIFGMITRASYEGYSFDLEAHPFVAGEFIVGMFLIVFSIIQLIMGYRKKKNGFNFSESTSKNSKESSSASTNEKKEIPPDEEIY